MMVVVVEIVVVVVETSVESVHRKVHVDNNDNGDWMRDTLAGPSFRE